MKNNKAKEAIAAAIVQTLWIRGKITTQERDAIRQKAVERLQKSNC